MIDKENEKYSIDFEEFDDTKLTDEDLKFWEKKQRELITSVVDYNLESLSTLIKKKTIDLAPRYQRRFRWDEVRKSRLIESFLMNVPIPPVFLNEDDFGKYSVIDGKQRLASINQFMKGELTLTGLEVFSQINGFTFFDLPGDFQNVLKTRSNLRAIIILRQSDSDVKFEVFHRLNTGGVKLNPQEIRNSAYPGPFNDLLLQLSEHKLFHQLLGIKAKTKSGIYKEMKDVELVLRFLSLYVNWSFYKGNMKRVLDQFIFDQQHQKEDILVEFGNVFLGTLEVVKTIFGIDGAFRRWLPNNEKWKNKVSAPLFDAQMFACVTVKLRDAEKYKNEILIEYKQLFYDDTEFISSIERSTGIPKNFNYRVVTLKEIISKYIK